MKRLTNIAGLSAEAVDELSARLDASPDAASAANLRKGQFIFPAEADGMACVVKVYFHRTVQHRLASALGAGNADRYVSICERLAAHGVPVPKPLLLVRRGAGFLPDRTLLAMSRFEGRMLLDELPAIEEDAERSAVLVPKVAGLIRGMVRARVVHRDLSSKNILIDDDGGLMLIDFDSSRTHLGGEAGFREKHGRDLANFVFTCRLAPRFAEAVMEALRSEPTER